MTDLTVVKSALAPGRIDDFIGAVVPARARIAPTSSPDADLGNVIAFEPRRRGEKSAPAVACDAAERPAPQTQAAHRRRQSALLVVGSLAIHSALLAAFLREPTPHASIGLEVISVELVVGANQMAGTAQTPTVSESQINTPLIPTKDVPEAQTTETARDETRKPVEQVVEPVEQERQTQPAAAQPLVTETLPERQPDPELTATTKPTEKPTTLAATTTDNPEIRNPEKPKPEPKPAAKRSREKGKDARDVAPAASPQSIASSGIGRGRSDADSNYSGLVRAHLNRFKQMPSDLRNSGNRGLLGTATVTFSLDGSGRVTSVRLARGSGVPSIDQETQSMVRRASPFPAPPAGRSTSFTVPVGFALN